MGTIHIVVGTRPEIIKMAPIVLEAKRRGLEFRFINTTQHYDREMSGVFFEGLGLPEPDYHLGIGSGSQAQQTAKAMVELERLFSRERPSVVLVEGDTNTVLAGALAAGKMGIAVGHVEAGLRSHDLRMPEEHNRRLTDHISSHLFAPTEGAVKNLVREDVWGKIYLTGNTIIDACLRYLPLAVKESDILSSITFEEFALATIHRAENVDNPTTLANLMEILEGCPLPVVLPAHPRTVQRLKEFGLLARALSCGNLQVIPPADYFAFLVLMHDAQFLLTDSGGIQEEASAPNIQKPVFVLRDSTERSEAVDAGYAQVVGTDPVYVLARLRTWSRWKPRGPCPFGDGFAARRILDIVGNLDSGLLPARQGAGLVAEGTS